MAKNKALAGKSFAGIPRIVMDHPDYLALPGNAVKLLLELARQYRGHNNGDLCASWSKMKDRGFNSKATLDNALDALLAANLVIRTRVGRFANPGGVCALYALAWLPVDECGGKLDVRPTTTAPRCFSRDVAEIRKTPGSVSVYGRPRNCTGAAPETVPSAASIDPDSGVIRQLTQYRN